MGFGGNGQLTPEAKWPP